MDFQLAPLTEPGARFVELAEQHAEDFVTRADQHDRDGTFPFENVDALRKSGVLAACVPADLGGLGVDSVHDYALGINRLGRGDGSTAIAANMHIFRPWWMAWHWRAAKADGDRQTTERVEPLLRQIGAGQLVMCALISEPGTDLLHPLVEATPTDGGWLLNGHKPGSSGRPGGPGIFGSEGSGQHQNLAGREKSPRATA
jgi:alkylation response protein AidB-like acyl-CoA dehydrogenase